MSHPSAARFLPTILVILLGCPAAPLRALDFDRRLAALSCDGDYAAAETLLLERLGREPSYTRGWIELAALRKNRGDFTGACAAYETVLRRGPDPRVSIQLADALRVSGRLDDAARLYREILDAAPAEPDPRWGLALVRFQQSRQADRVVAKAAAGEARELLEGLTEARPDFALGLWRLAEVCEDLGDRDAALAAYGKTLAIDANFRKAHARMARLLEVKKDYEGALARLERAKAVEPGNPELAEQARRLDRKAPEATQRQAARREEQWCRLKTPREKPLPVTPVTVRVGIDTGLGHLRFKGGSDLNVTTPAGTFVTRLARETEYRIRYRSAPRETWELQDAGGRMLASFDARIWIVPDDPRETLALHAVSSGSGYFFAKEEDRFYRGWIEISPRKGRGFNVVNWVNLEACTAGTLPSEMPSTWPLEALKVQAVLARSYVLAKMGRHNGEGFDVCDEVHCAAYHGVGAETERTNQAVNETAGMVLKTGRRVLSVVYAAQCGGRTQDYEEAWGYAIPVVGVKDYSRDANRGVEFPLTPARLEDWILDSPEAYCNAPDLKGYRNFRWSHVVPGADLEAKNPAIGPLRRVVVTRRSRAGWVTRLVLVGDRGEKEYRGDSIRGILGGLRSNLVHLETPLDPDGRVSEVLVYGGGWGHGVGLCQVGVWGQVKAGRDWKAILKHYFPKASLKKL
jgi:SpoIID/LytB domain protein